MELKYERYPYSDILGWSISRYEVFDKCKRQYFFQYYARYAEGVPSYKIKQLKELTSTALEVGNVVHDVLEAFLRRLQKSSSDVDEKRFFEYAAALTADYFSRKSFLEVYYGTVAGIDVARALSMVELCLKNFINSPVYSWIFMKAITNRANWMIEPEGYGETRLAGLKAYCKMDFLFPVDGDIVILDWKTGKKDMYKHSSQLIGYAAAASSNFGIPWKTIYPKIVYLSPQFDEFELKLRNEEFEGLFKRTKAQTEEMYSYCADIEKNKPLAMERFPKTPSTSMCGWCNFQELCFPDRKRGASAAAPVDIDW